STIAAPPPPFIAISPPRSSASRSSDFPRFFFFQAEDGIRDLYVTGVQTCALPISATSAARSSSQPSAAVSNSGNARKSAPTGASAAVVIASSVGLFPALTVKGAKSAKAATHRNWRDRKSVV